MAFYWLCCENIIKCILELYKIAETFNVQVKEMESQLKSRDKKIQKLKLSCQIAKENEHSGDENSESSESSDGAPSRGDLAVSILQREIKDAEKRTHQLESQLRFDL